MFAVFSYRYGGGLVKTEKENIRDNSSKEFNGCVLYFSLSIHVKIMG